MFKADEEVIITLPDIEPFNSVILCEDVECAPQWGVALPTNSDLKSNLKQIYSECGKFVGIWNARNLDFHNTEKFANISKHLSQEILFIDEKYITPKAGTLQHILITIKQEIK